MCGIIGIAKQQEEASLEIYDGLLMLQHRGQDAAGMVTYDGEHFHERKDNGLVKDVFHTRHMKDLAGKVALGHVRYPTAGTLNAKEAQPFFVNAPFGIYLIHNGNLTNTDSLRAKIQQQYHRHLRTNSDSEVLLNVFADKIYQVRKKDEQKCPIDSVFEAAKLTMNTVTGAYSVITIIDEVGLFAFRDRAGIRPLILGKKSTPLGNEWIIASEDVAIKALGYEVERDVKPGEAILIKPNGELVSRICAPGELHPCIFEYVYLARPDSMLDKISVYKTQLRMGAKLSEQIKASGLQIDSVIPVPDSSRPVALEIAQTLGIKYREGLIKNRYVGRTFIMPGQAERKKSIRQKLNPIELEFRNRNVLLVDDSIVRGNTMKKIVQMCRHVGAKNIYIAIGAPPVENICMYGVDMPTKRELIASGLKIAEIKKVLNIDVLFYQTIDDLIETAKAGNPDIEKFCTGCFGGDYVTEEVTPEFILDIENKGRGATKTEDLPLLDI